MTDKAPATLDRLWDDIPTGSAPIGDLITAGYAARRHKRRTALAGVAAVTALIAGAGFFATNAFDSAKDASIAVDNPGQSAPGGMRLVGIGRVVIAVPSAWGSNDASCNTPFHDTYYYPYGQDCVLASLPAVSSVAISSTFTETGTVIRNLVADGEVDGHEVQASRVACEADPSGTCRQAFGIPDLDAYFTVTVAEDENRRAVAQIAIIRQSLAVLPDSQTIVPFFTPGDDEADVAQGLEGAGLTVTIEHIDCPANTFCVGQSVTRMVPTAGTVVPKGTTVLVTALQ